MPPHLKIWGDFTAVAFNHQILMFLFNRPLEESEFWQTLQQPCQIIVIQPSVSDAKSTNIDPLSGLQSSLVTEGPIFASSGLLKSDRIHPTLVAGIWPFQDGYGGASG